MDETLGEHQYALCMGQSTTDHIFSTRMNLEKSYTYNVQIHQLELNHEQELDSINRHQFEEIMNEFGIPG
jgi:hypothetical protein